MLSTGSLVYTVPLAHHSFCRVQTHTLLQTGPQLGQVCGSASNCFVILLHVFTSGNQRQCVCVCVCVYSFVCVYICTQTHTHNVALTMTFNATFQILTHSILGYLQPWLKEQKAFHSLASLFQCCLCLSQALTLSSGVVVNLQLLQNLQAYVLEACFQTIQQILCLIIFPTADFPSFPFSFF